MCLVAHAEQRTIDVPCQNSRLGCMGALPVRIGKVIKIRLIECEHPAHLSLI